MKSVAVALTVLMVGLLLASCGIPQEVQDELDQLRVEKEQLRAEKEQWGKEKEQLETTIEDLERELAKCPKNPTYDELMEFIREDPTETLWATYENHYVLARELICNAEKKGIIGFHVEIDIREGQTWGFAGFETTDRGVVYILTPRDREVTLEVGTDYAEVNGFSRAEIGNVDSTVLAIRERRCR